MQQAMDAKKVSTNLFYEHFFYRGLTLIRKKLFYCDMLSRGLYCPLVYYTPSTGRYYSHMALVNVALRVAFEIAFLDMVFYQFPGLLSAQCCHWSGNESLGSSCM